MTRLVLIAIVIVFATLVHVDNMGRAYIDRDSSRLQRRDYYADRYTARVVANDWRDMYSKRLVEQTQKEKRMWTKAQSSPYPPLALLALGAMHKVGSSVGLGYYEALIGMEILTALLILIYCWQTRWYVFLLLFSNFYLAKRICWHSGASDLTVLLLLVVALLLIRKRPLVGQVLTALAICVKLTPVFFLSSWRRFSRTGMVATGLILFTGLLLPFVALEGYGDIWGYHGGRSLGRVYSALSLLGLDGLAPLAAPLAWVVPLLIAGASVLFLSHLQRELEWDWEDRVGWCCVPFALLFSLRTLTMRIMFFAMMVPDKRGPRSCFIAYMGLAEMVLTVCGLRGAMKDAAWDAFGFLGFFALVWHFRLALKERREG